MTSVSAPLADVLSAEVADWPVGAAAVAVIGPAGVLATSGDVDRRHPWASVTKIVTALTVLDTVGEGEIDLDEPAGPPGATVRHLLAHASGLPFDQGGPTAAVGVKRTYSNLGFDVLADFVSTRVRVPFGELARDRILEPLGMTASLIDGSPARDGSGPLADLVRLAAEMLNPELLDPSVVAAASTVTFPGLDGILPGFGRQSPNDWGLGWEIRDHKGPHWTGSRNSPRTFGHFGQSGSFLWVDPVAGVACVGLADTAFGPWAATAWPHLADAVLSAVAAG